MDHHGSPSRSPLHESRKLLMLDDVEAKAALDCATAIYVYGLPLVMAKLTPFLLRAIARGVRVLTLDHHLPSAADTKAIAQLPADCQPLVCHLKPRRVLLFGKMRLYDASVMPRSEAPPVGLEPPSPLSTVPLSTSSSSELPPLLNSPDPAPTPSTCSKRQPSWRTDQHGGASLQECEWSEAPRPPWCSPHMPNRIKPFRWVEAAAMVRQALVLIEHSFIRCMNLTVPPHSHDRGSGSASCAVQCDSCV